MEIGEDKFNKLCEEVVKTRELITELISLIVTARLDEGGEQAGGELEHKQLEIERPSLIKEALDFKKQNFNSDRSYIN